MCPLKKITFWKIVSEAEYEPSIQFYALTGKQIGTYTTHL